ncbi:hypothetical protein NPIL_182061 [Nephila pilipes]|uniref:Uncharacterized protein n=1 Tax=Nephila pilipes TaxID=299642 RepID=A0A8X6PIZ4_NEPPI|nr:hypothetical protein NPIL_182061 [Nephila pilipes]
MTEIKFRFQLAIGLYKNFDSLILVNEYRFFMFHPSSSFDVVSIFQGTFPAAIKRLSIKPTNDYINVNKFPNRSSMWERFCHPFGTIEYCLLNCVRRDISAGFKTV